MKKELKEKLTKLQEYLKSLNKVAVAFSGGTDSSLLLYVAHEVLKDNVIALSVKSPYIAKWEIEEAVDFVNSYNIKHKTLELSIDESIKFNPQNRCYLCKMKVFSILKAEAEKNGFTYLADGTNYDDISDYRPGIKALKELNIKSPLLECMLTKQDIRDISKFYNLPTWDKPAYACLLTRLPHDKEICFQSLDRIESGEKFLISNGLKAVRVREHDGIARIEIPENDMKLLFKNDLRINIVKTFKELGYDYVCIDLQGYRTGSMQKK
jgi:uncharacterized protein